MIISGMNSILSRSSLKRRQVNSNVSTTRVELSLSMGRTIISEMRIFISFQAAPEVFLAASFSR